MRGINVEQGRQRRLEDDHRVGGVDQRRACDRNPQPAVRRAAVNPVIRVRRIVDEPATLLDPSVDRVPGHVHITRCLRDRIVREVADCVGRKCEAERTTGAVHKKCALGVDHKVAVAQRLNSPRVRLDEYHAVGQWRREPSGGILRSADRVR